MKTSWIIGIMMAWLLIFGLEVFATGGTSFSTTSSGIANVATVNHTALMSPSFIESTNLFTGAWAVITGVAAYLLLIVQILALWSPTVFSGNLLWVWWYICFPVDCGMVLSIVFIARGVHSA